MFLNLNTVTVEEVIGRLRVFEEHAKPNQITDAMGRLMLCEEDWEARRKARRDEENSGGNAGSSSRGKRRGRGCGRGGGGSSSRDGRDGQSAGAGNSGGGRSPLGDRCKNCGKTGHWAKDCGGKKKAAAYVAQAQTDEEDPALMLAAVELVAGDILEPAPAAPSPNPTSRRVDLVEAKVLFQRDGQEEDAGGSWVLDTGATNHMTGDRSAFAELDPAVCGTVRFGDGSLVNIEGRGTVLFACKSGEHRALTGIYYIPRLTANIVSIGQLIDAGMKVVIEDGVLRLYDHDR